MALQLVELEGDGGTERILDTRTLGSRELGDLGVGRVRWADGQVVVGTFAGRQAGEVRLEIP